MNKFNFSALLITVAILVGFNHIQAAWSDPAAAPTGSNTAAPINVSNDGQIKTGPLGVGGLDVAGGVFMEGGSTNHLDFEFTNTADSAPSTWSVRRNDGTDDWLSYLNIQSATTNLLQSAGYAYRERYNPGAGNYLFQVSDNATAGAAGDTVGWKTAIAIGPDGSVTINDLNGPVPPPPTCTGNSALQWDGSNWGCKAGAFSSTSGTYASCTTYDWNLYSTVTKAHGEVWTRNSMGGTDGKYMCMDGTVVTLEQYKPSPP